MSVKNSVEELQIIAQKTAEIGNSFVFLVERFVWSATRLRGCLISTTKRVHLASFWANVEVSIHAWRVDCG